jgi:Transposase DDE domain
MGARSKRPVSEAELSRWRLIEEFEERLERAKAASPEARTFSDPRRKLGQKDYLSLLLLGLFNPVVDSMRGLCAASRLRRVQEEVCSAPVSLGSFSEAQAVVEPALLQRVFAELASEQQRINSAARERRLEPYRANLLVVDGTLWRALPRMAWALWRFQHGRESALRLHVKFNLWEEKPVGALLTSARRCERAVLRRQLKAGEFYVGDRYYGEDYSLFGELEKAGCSYLLRLRQGASFEVMEEWPLSEADQRASVTFDGLVRLGSHHRFHRDEPVRLIRVQTDQSELLLVSNKGREELSGELLALIYRSRWRVELFFKWLKCILGCRHWLAESERGVALQVYCALIAALLLLRRSGRRPGKRAMEMIRFYLLGYATLDELSNALALEEKSV